MPTTFGLFSTDTRSRTARHDPHVDWRNPESQLPTFWHRPACFNWKTACANEGLALFFHQKCPSRREKLVDTTTRDPMVDGRLWSSFYPNRLQGDRQLALTTFLVVGNPYLAQNRAIKITSKIPIAPNCRWRISKTVLDFGPSLVNE
jgi:hypothetical protein